MNLNGKSTYLAKHKRRHERDPSAWDTILAMDLMADCDKQHRMPESMVEAQSLSFGLAVIYAGDWVHGEAFLRRAIALADRIIANDMCSASPICEQAYPRNLGVVLRGRAYARWLLREQLDKKEMRRVAECMTEWCLTKAIDKKRFNDSITMCMYLEGVRAAMIATDLDYASELLKTKHKFRWHHAIERDLWTRLIAAYPDVSEELRRDVESFFDRVRDPDFAEKPDGKVPTFIRRDILALETGIIRQMYLGNASPHDSVDPQTVIDAIAF